MGQGFGTDWAASDLTITMDIHQWRGAAYGRQYQAPLREEGTLSTTSALRKRPQNTFSRPYTGLSNLNDLGAGLDVCVCVCVAHGSPVDVAEAKLGSRRRTVLCAPTPARLWANSTCARGTSLCH